MYHDMTNEKEEKDFTEFILDYHTVVSIVNEHESSGYLTTHARPRC